MVFEKIQILMCLSCMSSCFVSGQHFPLDFKFGVATAAYQIEGAWNVDGKTQNIWDYAVHNFPERIVDGSNGDVACNSYYSVEEDVANLKKLGVKFYRFSLSWTRILPTGFTNQINDVGVAYYNQLIDALVANNIEPMITIYHWDLPQNLQELGGWTNPLITDYFADYASLCFKLFGDRVKMWITINEPMVICLFAYELGATAPFIKANNIGTYLCRHHLILAHAKAYHIYKNDFAKSQKGRVGFTVESSWYEPQNDEDQEAADRQMQMYLGGQMHPIYSKEGDYPQIARERIQTISNIQGFESSRLPSFTEQEIHFVRGSFDFLGVNHYTTFYAKSYTNPNYTVPSFAEDIGVKSSMDESWEETGREDWKVVPWGLRKLLNWIKNEYDNPEVVITENGFAGFKDEGLDDDQRINYMKRYLEEVSKAIRFDGCNVTGYTFWSLMDNFEWSDGYTLKFGLFNVNFDDPQRRRTAKKSVYVYRDIIATKRIEK